MSVHLGDPDDPDDPGIPGSDCLMKRGSQQTEESRRKISESKKGQGHSAAAREKIGRAMKKQILAVRVSDGKRLCISSINETCERFKITRIQFYRIMKRDQIINGWKVEYFDEKK